MVFTTLPFAAFFVSVFIGYYLLPRNLRWWLLLVASLVFYAYMTPYYLIFLGLATVVTYCAARAIDSNLNRQKAWIATNGKTVDRVAKRAYKDGMEKRRKGIVAVVIVVLIGMLVAFKYLDFLVANFSWLCGVFGVGASFAPFNLLLPIGLSFYTFQSLGYCIDVEREVVSAERNFFRHALFVSYFPQVLQGPIGNYDKLSSQLFEGRDFEYRDAVFGGQRVAWGLFKKLVIANGIASITNPIWLTPSLHYGAALWLFVLALYSIQLYADFSGYMDMACGCSQMLGIRLEENFDCPYFSGSIAEFWRRWHMTLGAWFKDYVFYPLMRSEFMSRVRNRLRGNDYLSSTVPTVLTLLVVWLLIGLWHGADWSYVVYGLYHGGFVMLASVLAPVYKGFNERCPVLVSCGAYRWFRIARTFMIVTLGYVIFRPADLAVTRTVVEGCLTVGLRPFGALILGNWAQFCKVGLGTVLLIMIDWVHFVHPGCSVRERISRMNVFCRYSVYVVFILSIIFLGEYAREELNQFAYFKF